jgi:hypothetical protein
MTNKIGKHIPLGNYLKEKPLISFLKSDLFAGLILYGKKIMMNGFANVTASTVLYTVPANRTLFICNISLTGDNDLGASSDAINIRIGSSIFFELYVNRVGTAVNNLALTYPIMLEAGEKITIYAGSTAKAVGSFFGYEIDTSYIPNFV